MVFGRNKPWVVGLESGEEARIRYRTKIGGFMKKRKMYWIITNQRLLLVDRGTKKIEQGYDLDRVSVAVDDKRVFSPGDSGGTVTTSGRIRFSVDGVTVGFSQHEYHPEDFVAEAQSYINAGTSSRYSDHSQSSVKDYSRGLLPRDFVTPSYESTSVTPSTSTTPESSEDPLKILKLRFAKGEITKDEYENMRKMLE